jgi:molecular chaperone DnaK
MGTQLTVAFGTDQKSASEISVYILRELKGSMAAELARRAPGVEYDLSRAIITVPAYFDLPAIEATRQAGERAGLQVIDLLHEPTAAAIYYCWKHDLGDGIYMVYDLGGGTFDVSILRRVSGEFMVLGIAGDNFLGGDDFDRRLAEYLQMLLMADGYDLDLDVQDTEDQLRFKQLTVIAEQAKKELSVRDEIVLRNQGTLVDKSGVPVVIETTLQRKTFEDLIDDLLERTVSACDTSIERAAQKSGITAEDISHIVLVGGSTYVPAVIERVRDAYCGGKPDGGRKRTGCQAPIRDEPETAVALGAALRAAAAGVGIGDDARRVRLWFLSSGATRQEQAVIHGRVELLEPELNLDGGSIRLYGSAGEHLGDTELSEGLRFAFVEVPLEADSVNQFRFEVLNSDDEIVAVIERAIVRVADQKQAVGRALSTAVLSRPILLEATDGDRLVRTVLLSEGTPLPASARFTFSISEPSGHIRLPILQENRIIKELQADVGATAPGTPVDVQIECDEQVHIQVRFSLGERQFGGHIEPPPPDAVPSEYELQDAEQRFLAVLGRLDEADAASLLARYQQVRRDAHDARRGADYPKLVQRAADMEGLIREARLSEPLDPPLQAVEQQFRSCLEILPQATGVRADLPAESLRADLESAWSKAQDSYRRRHRQEYEDACRAIATALQFLAGVTRAGVVAGDQQLDVTVQAVLALDQVRGLSQFVLIQCLVAGQKGFVDALTRHLEETQLLEQKLSSSPIDVLHRCQVLYTETQRIYEQAFGGQKRSAELEGLLRVEQKSFTADLTSTSKLRGSVP